MSLRKIIRFFDLIVQTPAKVLYRVSGAMIILMTFLTATDVILRNLANKPIIGSFDLMEFMMVILVASGLTQVIITKSNINTDVVLTRFPRYAQNIVNLVTGFLGICFVTLMTWQTFVEMSSSRELSLTSGVLLIPVYPFIAITGLCMVFMYLALVKEFLELLAQARSKESFKPIEEAGK